VRNCADGCSREELACSQGDFGYDGMKGGEDWEGISPVCVN
jgi:hypothetical protein